MCNTTDFPMKICLGVQLGANQAKYAWLEQKKSFALGGYCDASTDAILHPHNTKNCSFLKTARDGYRTCGLFFSTLNPLNTSTTARPRRTILLPQGFVAPSVLE